MSEPSSLLAKGQFDRIAKALADPRRADNPVAASSWPLGAVDGSRCKRPRQSAQCLGLGEHGKQAGELALPPDERPPTEDFDHGRPIIGPAGGRFRAAARFGGSTSRLTAA